MTTKTKFKKPAYYRTPLRNPEKIRKYLLDYDNRPYESHDDALFAWNVKCYSVNMDFDHLLEVWIKDNGDEELAQNPEWLEKAKELYEEHEEHLFDWGIEGARNLVTDSDCYDHLWDGTPVNVEYGFAGRQGGWLVIEKFDGHRLRNEEDLENLSDDSLRELYALVRMLEHDITRKIAEGEVEHHAAFDFFENICNDIKLTPKPEQDLGAGI